MPGTARRGRGRGARRKAAPGSVGATTETDSSKEDCIIIESDNDSGKIVETDGIEDVCKDSENDEKMTEGDISKNEGTNQSQDEKDGCEEMESEAPKLDSTEQDNNLSASLDISTTNVESKKTDIDQSNIQNQDEKDGCEKMESEPTNLDSTEKNDDVSAKTDETKQEAEGMIEVKIETSEAETAPEVQKKEVPEEETKSGEEPDVPEQEPAMNVPSAPVRAGTPTLDEVNLAGDDKKLESEDQSTSKEDEPVKTDTQVDDADEDKITVVEALKKSANVILSPIVSKATEQVERPFPASLAKLRQLKVNIGPIKQCDLKSEKLHEVLRLNDTFEIKFELREKKGADGNVVQEKTGFVRIPFEIRTPNFLIKVASILGNLHIDGKNMSVTFPDAFNKALDECKEYMVTTRKIRAEQMELKKRQIVVKNVPPNVTEDTIRSLFPEAEKITLSIEESPEGEKKVGGVLLDYKTEGACIKCLKTNKDVFIEDCQLKISRLISGPKTFSSGGFGRGRGNINRVSRGVHHAMKIKARAGIGAFRSSARGSFRGRGSMTEGRGRGSARFGKRSNDTRSNATGTSQSLGTMSKGTGPPQSSFSGNKGGSSFNHGQFASAGGKVNRDRVRPVRGRGSPRFKNESPRDTSFRNSNTSQFRQQGSSSYVYQGRGTRNSQYRAAPVKQESHKSTMYSARQSSYRDGRQSRSPATQVRSSSFKDEQRFSPGRSRQSSGVKDEDPMAMMAYLKTTLERMEEKFSHSGSRDREQGRYPDESPTRSQFSARGRGRGRGSPPQGRGRGRGNTVSRKRGMEDREYSNEAKRPYILEDRNRDTPSYTSSQNYSSSKFAICNRGTSYGQFGGSYQQSGNNKSTQNYGQSSSSSYSQRQSESPGQFGQSNNYGQNYSGGNYTSRGIVQYSSSSGGGRNGGSRGRGQSNRGKQNQRW